MVGIGPLTTNEDTTWKYGLLVFLLRIFVYMWNVGGSVRGWVRGVGAWVGGWGPTPVGGCVGGGGIMIIIALFNHFRFHSGKVIVSERPYKICHEIKSGKCLHAII